jgi:hypothetical protein
MAWEDREWLRFSRLGILILLLFRKRDKMVILPSLFYGLLFLGDSTMYSEGYTMRDKGPSYFFHLFVMNVPNTRED